MPGDSIWKRGRKVGQEGRGRRGVILAGVWTDLG